VSHVRKFPRAKPHRLGKFEVKALVRHRDGYRCQGCGMTARQHVKQHGRTLDVHRLVPGSRYTVKGCITLCRKCHGPQPKSPRGTTNNVLLRLPLDLHDALEAEATLQRRSIGQMVALLLEEILSQKGKYPPPQKPSA
jgi:hypothetical protein